MKWNGMEWKPKNEEVNRLIDSSLMEPIIEMDILEMAMRKIFQKTAEVEEKAQSKKEANNIVADMLQDILKDVATHEAPNIFYMEVTAEDSEEEDDREESVKENSDVSEEGADKSEYTEEDSKGFRVSDFMLGITMVPIKKPKPVEVDSDDSEYEDDRDKSVEEVSNRVCDSPHDHGRGQERSCAKGDQNIHKVMGIVFDDLEHIYIMVRWGRCTPGQVYTWMVRPGVHLDPGGGVAPMGRWSRLASGGGGSCLEGSS